MYAPPLFFSRAIVSKILAKRNVSDEAQAALLLIQMSQEKQQKSATSVERKKRIKHCLF